MRFGPRRMRGPTLPNVYGAGYLNAATLNHRLRLWPPGTSYQPVPGTMSGGVLKSALNWAWLDRPGVNGVPVSNMVVPENCHPSTMWRAAPCTPDTNF